MKIFTIALFALLSTAFMACGNNPPAPQPPKIELPKIANDEQSCRALNGEWKRQGRIGNYSCVYTAKDAGKQCTDSSQCEYMCLAQRTTESPVSGSKATGQCQVTSSVFGCKYEILGGVVQRGLCID